MKFFKERIKTMRCVHLNTCWYSAQYARAPIPKVISGLRSPHLLESSQMQALRGLACNLLRHRGEVSSGIA